MNKIFKIWSILILMGLLTSCADSFVDNYENEAAQKSLPSHTIPLLNALKSLDDFMNDPKSGETRSNNTRRVKNVITVNLNGIPTRSDGLGNENSLLYVANFENNEGYALLAADDRISEDVLAVTESGNLSPAMIQRAMEGDDPNPDDGPNTDMEDRPVFTDYPTEGEGFFTVPDYPDELFMNPNTVDLSIPEENDTLVGNFNEEDDETETRSGGKVNSGSPAEYILSLCVSYAKAQVMSSEVPLGGGGNGDDGNGGGDGEDDNTDHDTSSDGDNPDTDNPGIGGGSGKVTFSYGSWVTKKQIFPMLTFATDWHQGSPFNDYYPKRRRYLLFGQRKHAPAGCFPLAIAKIMVYHNCPIEYVVNVGTKVKTANLKSLSRYWNEEKRKDAATLLYAISQSCKCWYFYGGTFTFPGRAGGELRTHGIVEARCNKYTDERVRTMLEKGYPFIIYGCHNLDVTKSHSWNIDGYKIKVREVIKYVNGNQYGEPYYESKMWVHCDMGWGGSNNGYYVSGIFNSKDSEVEFDGSKLSKKKNYNKFLYVITYDSVNRSL